MILLPLFFPKASGLIKVYTLPFPDFVRLVIFILATLQKQKSHKDCVCLLSKTSSINGSRIIHVSQAK